MSFRTTYNFFADFLKFPREERQKICEELFLNPESQDDIYILNNIKSMINNASTYEERKNSLEFLNKQWNDQLFKIEDTHPSLVNISLEQDVLQVVIGGKQTDGLRGVGDQIVEQLLENGDSRVLSFSRTDISNSPRENYTHFTEINKLIKTVVDKKASYKKVVFFYTLGVTGDNGKNSINNDLVEKFITLLKDSNLLNDPNVVIIQTSSYHVSPKSAGYEDSLSSNYGLLDYGASKLLQTLQFLEAIYSVNPDAASSEVYKRLIFLKKCLEIDLQILRDVWSLAYQGKAAFVNYSDINCNIEKIKNDLNKSIIGAGCVNPPDELDNYGRSYNVIDNFIKNLESTAEELFEDSFGESSIIFQLQKFSNRFEVVKVSYMLSNTAVYKRMFIWPVALSLDKNVWDFYKSCSVKRFSILQSSNQAAIWHIAIANSLLK